MNTTLIIQNLDEATIESLSTEAKQRGINVEEFVRQLIKNKIKRYDKPIVSKVYHDLDALAGTWSKEQAEEFSHAIIDFNQIDERLWK